MRQHVTMVEEVESSGEEFDSRVHIVDANGKVERAKKDVVSGLDDFVESWQHNVDIPHAMSFEAWQMADDEHPAGEGKPAYRIVHKTIRTVVFPGIRMDYPNAQLRMLTGPVVVGEPRFTSAIAGRRSGDFLVPEWGEIVVDTQHAPGYRWKPNPQVDIEAHQETFPSGNYLEILYQLPQDGDWQRYEDMLAAGRAGVAPITAVLDFLYGERLLGPTLTEEVGEVFQDWHWNRRLGGRTVAMESQARLEFLNGHEVGANIDQSLGRFVGLPDEERQRCRVAAQWYWRADSEVDPVQRYICYWLVVEALELGEKVNIYPVKAAVARILSVDLQKVSEGVGRVYGLRSKLVHGVLREVSDDASTTVRALAAALLEDHTLGRVSVQRVASLRAGVCLG